MAISKRVRYEVLRRDGNRCRYCGASATDGAVLTIDHVIPVALGGSDDPTNLVAACRDCNAGKTSSSPDAPLVADVAADAARWRGAMGLAAARLEHDLEQLRDYRDAFYDEWMSWTFTSMAKPAELPDNWRSTIDRWNAAGLPIAVLTDSVSIAMGSQADRWSKFPYLCGVVKRRLNEMREHANAIFEGLTAGSSAPEDNPELQHGLFRAHHSDPARLLEHVIDGSQPINPALQRLIWAA